jgi:tellurite resistance protein
MAALRELSPHLDNGQRETAVRSAVQVAVADGTVGPAEQKLIHDVAEALDVSEAHLGGILSQLAATAKV